MTAQQGPISPEGRELDAHLAEHGCGTGDTHSPDYVGGFIHCPVAFEIWERMPPEERVVLG